AGELHLREVEAVHSHHLGAVAERTGQSPGQRRLARGRGARDAEHLSLTGCGERLSACQQIVESRHLAPIIARAPRCRCPTPPRAAAAGRAVIETDGRQRYRAAQSPAQTLARPFARPSTPEGVPRTRAHAEASPPA